jgi:Ca-activated chloride channel family protein
MNRPRLFALVLSSVAAASVAAQQPTFRGTADTVRVFTTVTDRDGRLVTMLEQKDFEVRDEGSPQPITTFDNRPQPIRLIVLLDVSGSMQGNLPILRDGTVELLRHLREDDGVRLGTFGNDVEISPTFTRDPRELERALPRAIASDAPTPLWRAIDQALDAFQAATSEPSGDERPVILVLSDGKDSGPVGPASFRQPIASQSWVIERARRQGVMLYGVGMRSRGARPQVPGIGPGGLQAALMSDFPDPGLARVAEETGGGYIEIRFGQDLAAAFAEVADELHSQYLIGFAPPKRDGKVHQIEVKVATKGLKPRARRSYVAPSERKP